METNIINAFLKPLESTPENYSIKQLKEPVQFMQDYMGWAVYTREKTDPVRVKFTTQVNQYNQIVQAILDTPGFVEFFVKSNLIVSKDQIKTLFSSELADLIFSMEEYEFIYQLHVKGDFLFDRIRAEYEYSIDQPENTKVITNESDDLRDATFLLCLQLEKDGLMPEDVWDESEENEYADLLVDHCYEWFECYDQSRDDMAYPDGRVLRVIELLKQRGYLKEYLVKIDDTQPVLSSIYPLELFVLDLGYKNDNELTVQIEDLLKIGIFGGNSGAIQSYALIHFNEEETDTLNKAVTNENGFFMSLDDGTGTGFIFNLTADQVVKIVSKLNFTSFIFGTDPAPSTPCFYNMDESGSINKSPLDEIYQMDNLETIAPHCNDVWKNLSINDHFRESLWSKCHEQ